MENDKDIQSVPIIYSEDSISLPLDENAFKDFMVSLLGQPETIEGSVEGAFEIDFGGFEYISNLIDDRISKQNISSLLEFKAKLFFNDGSSMSFNGIQKFLQYNELRPLICEGFIFTWSYLVKFGDKQASERQEITILSTNQAESKSASSRKVRFLGISIELSTQMPRVAYTIRCTNKGWGVEIAELVRMSLLKFINTDLSIITAIRRKIIEYFDLVELTCILLGFLAIFSSTFFSTSSESRNCQVLVEQTGTFLGSAQSVDAKLDFVVQLIAACEKQASPSLLTFLIVISPFVLLGICAFALPILIFRIVQLPNYRFFLFTEGSKKERSNYFRRMKDRKTFWVITVLIGLIIGVLGNYIFNFLTGIFR